LTVTFEIARPFGKRMEGEEEKRREERKKEREYNRSRKRNRNRSKSSGIRSKKKQNLFPTNGRTKLQKSPDNIRAQKISIAKIRSSINGTPINMKTIMSLIRYVST